jgi:hypothetical protein
MTVSLPGGLIGGWFRAADRWFFAPAPALRLARFRVLTGAFAVGYLLVRLRVFLTLGDGANRGDFDPVGILWWLPRPWSPGVVQTLVVATLILGIGYMLGVAFRVVGPLFATALLVVTTYHSSGGQLLWFENLFVLHTLMVGVSRGADTFSIGSRGRPAPPDDVRYGWPLRLAAVTTLLTYMLAGLAKLRIGGIGWMSGESLRNHVAYSAARLHLLGGTPSPLGRVLVDHAWLFSPLAVLTIVVELGAPLAFVGRRCRLIWVAVTWMMHVSILATMYVVFPYPLSLIAFAPLFELESARPREIARRINTGGT